MTAHSADQKAEHLLRLSNEVGRIAGTLARLSADPSGLTPAPATADLPEIAADDILAVIRARRMRSHYFDEELFADPAWDMMLELLHAELTFRRVAISHLCSAAGVPATTALRWLTGLIKRGLFIRRDDPRDGRRTFVELSSETSAALRRYFGRIASVQGI